MIGLGFIGLVWLLIAGVIARVVVYWRQWADIDGERSWEEISRGQVSAPRGGPIYAGWFRGKLEKSDALSGGPYIRVVLDQEVLLLVKMTLLSSESAVYRIEETPVFEPTRPKSVFMASQFSVSEPDRGAELVGSLEQVQKLMAALAEAGWAVKS